MKTKLLLTLLVSTLFLSCNHFFDHSDDDDPGVTINLTATNNFYEGDLYKIYLETEIEATQSQIVYLQDIIDNNQGTPEIVQQLEDAQSALQSLNTLNDIQDAAEASIDFVARVPRIPIPPQPCPAGACIPNLLEYLTISQDIRSLSITFSDPQTQQEIATTTIDQFTPLPQYNDVVSATPISFNGYSGSVIITVQRTFANNATVNYSLVGNIY